MTHTAQLVADAAETLTSTTQCPHPQSDDDDILTTHPQLTTYAAAVKHSPHARAVTHCTAQARTIRLTPPSDNSESPLINLSEEVLVQKANLALELAREHSGPIPPDTQFIAARKTTHKNVLYEVDSEDMVAWLRSPEGQHLFASKFGTEISLASRPFSILVEYVPITLELENPNVHRDIKRRNNLLTGSIRSACWIKPVERYSPNQHCAHTIFDFFRPGGANHIIQNRPIILGKRCLTCKLLPEPTRCMKCQSFTGSHFAKECKSDHDTCGTCAGEH